MPHLLNLTLNNIEHHRLIRHQWAFRLVLKREKRVVIAGINSHRIRHLHPIRSLNYLAAMRITNSHRLRIPHMLIGQSKNYITTILKQQKIIMGRRIWQIDPHQYL